MQTKENKFEILKFYIVFCTARILLCVFFNALFIYLICLFTKFKMYICIMLPKYSSHRL